MACWGVPQSTGDEAPAALRCQSVIRRCGFLASARERRSGQPCRVLRGLMKKKKQKSLPAPQHRPAYREFLERLRKARSDAGLTQVELAKLLKRNQSWVSKKESGERRMDPVELCEIAKVYQLPVRAFLPDFPG